MRSPDIGQTAGYNIINTETNKIVCDQGQALKWYHKAAEQGHVNAQFELAQMYQLGKDTLSGEGITKNLDQAAYWYRKAAEQNNVVAQFKLAELYETGQGVTKDLKQAAHWYHKAAIQDCADAQARERMNNAIEYLCEHQVFVKGKEF